MKCVKDNEYFVHYKNSKLEEPKTLTKIDLINQEQYIFKELYLLHKLEIRKI